jgi:hypothetical protein
MSSHTVAATLAALALVGVLTPTVAPARSFGRVALVTQASTPKGNTGSGEHTKVGLTYQKIDWTWTNGSKSVSDSWNAH